jgi:glycerophosphoryl diester phosphodiesterase
MTAPRRILLLLLLLLLYLAAAGSHAVAAEPRPLVVAHRGLLRHAPENTLANFRACLELRLGFEFDVQATKDGRLVCIHDDTVDRTTDGTGRVAEMTLAEIRQLDAGSRFDPTFAGQKVPTVDEVLKLVAEYRQNTILVAVDFKAGNVARDVVRLGEEYGVLHRLLFIGRAISEPSIRDQLKRSSAQALTAALASNTEEFSGTLTAPDADWVYVRFLPSRAQIEAIHRARKRAFLAGQTVSGQFPENWRQAADVGVDAILTDYPLELRAAFSREGR